MTVFSDTPKKSILYGLIAGLIGMAFGAYLERRFRPPEVKTITNTVTVEKKGDTVVKEVAGPVRIQTVTQTRYVSKEGPTIEKTITQVVDRAPVVIDRHSETESSRQSVATELDKPLPDPPQWAVGTGVQLLPGRLLQVSVERRILGPLWLTAWALQPLAVEAPKSFGVGARLEF